MKEINPCTFSGCLGNCCKNIVIGMYQSEIDRLFPNAKKAEIIDNNGHKPSEEGIYYCPLKTEKGVFEVTIYGNCPHLLKNGDCDAYEIRSIAARKLQMGSEFCNQIRKSYELPLMVQREPVE